MYPAAERKNCMAENNESFLDEEEGIIELEDEEGNVTRFEFVDRIEYNGTVYYALVPAEYDEEEGATEFVVLKETVIDGNEMLATVDDDDEYETVGQKFLERFSELPELEIEDTDAE
jgi:uncharacterized protein YrzB (UPF0473 family)